MHNIIIGIFIIWKMINILEKSSYARVFEINKLRME